MVTKPPTCKGCPAEHQGKGYVPGVGPADATLALVGQGPGEHEAYAGEPFVGPSGRTLNKWLAAARINRSSVWVDNAVRCWLPRNRPPRQAELEFCANAHLRPALQALTCLEVVVPIGDAAAKSFLGNRAKGSVVGATIRWVLEHPSNGGGDATTAPGPDGGASTKPGDHRL